jgi:hypothetical protein
MNLFLSLSHADNGTYLCHGENDYGTSVAVMETVVFDKPEVKLDAVEAVGSDKVFFNWTVNDWNAPVSDYFLSVRFLTLRFQRFIENLLPNEYNLGFSTSKVAILL